MAVITTDKYGPAEIVGNSEECGFLFKNYDYEDLADKIEILNNDNNLRKKMASNGVKKVDSIYQFSREQKEIEKVLMEL